MNKVEQKHSFIERLKICWNVLTKHNYIYFGMRDMCFEEGEDGLLRAKKDKHYIACYAAVTYDVVLECKDGKEISLHDFVWGTVEKFAKEAREGKF